MYCQALEQKLCRLCDTVIVGTLFAGGVSTASTTGLYYTDQIDDWRVAVGSATVTGLAIIACLLRSLMKTNHQLSQRSTIIINNRSPPSSSDIELAAEIFEPRKA